jgi:hypothetical protein
MSLLLLLGGQLRAMTHFNRFGSVAIATVVKMSHSAQLLKASRPHLARVLVVQVRSNVLVGISFDSMLGSKLDRPCIVRTCLLSICAP